MSATQQGGGPPRGALAGGSEGAGGETDVTPESPMCDLDYEKNRGFFHYFLKIRGDSEKIGDFLHYFSRHPPRYSPRLYTL